MKKILALAFTMVCMLSLFAGCSNKPTTAVTIEDGVELTDSNIETILQNCYDYIAAQDYSETTKTTYDKDTCIVKQLGEGMENAVWLNDEKYELRETNLLVVFPNENTSAVRISLVVDENTLAVIGYIPEY